MEFRSGSRSRLKGAWLNVYGVKIAREQFLLRLSLFLPYSGLTVKMCQYLRLSTKYLVVLRLSVKSIEILIQDKEQLKSIDKFVIYNEHKRPLQLSSRECFNLDRCF